MYRNIPLDALTDSDVFHVEHLLPARSPIRNNTPAIVNSTQLSEAMEPESITISSVASPEPQIVTIDSDSNEPTIPYAFGTQHPTVPTSLNDFNFLANTFNVLATMTVIQQDQQDSPQSPEPSDPSPISTPPMNLSTIEDWETPHNTTDDNSSTRLKTSQDGPTGTFRQIKNLNLTSRDEYHLPQAHPPHPCLHRDKRED